MSRSSRTFRGDLVHPPRYGPNCPTGKTVEDTIARAGGSATDLEIGCGVGWHPIQYVRENPDRLLFAVEQTSEKFIKFRTRLDRHLQGGRSEEFAGLIPVHADVIAWLVHLPETIRFNRVFLLYPNPSRKNAAGRWVRMPFFGYLCSRLKTGGEILIRTNRPDYAQEVREEAAGWGMCVSNFREWDGSAPEAAHPWTHFERKYLERGEVCFEIVLTRGQSEPRPS